MRSFFLLGCFFPLAARSFLSTSRINVDFPKLCWNGEFRSQADSNFEKESIQQDMEESSKAGARKVASLSVAERTKRAMIAEVLEDRIFQNTEKLELLIDSGSEMTKSERSALQKKLLKVANETKSLQIQYDEVVSGGPSSVLNSMEAVMNGGYFDSEES